MRSELLPQGGAVETVAAEGIGLEPPAVLSAEIC
jgi:hypothetical protein